MCGLANADHQGVSDPNPRVGASAVTSQFQVRRRSGVQDKRSSSVQDKQSKISGVASKTCARKLCVEICLTESANVVCKAATAGVDRKS
jgi:hypothetical protein